MCERRQPRQLGLLVLRDAGKPPFMHITRLFRVLFGSISAPALTLPALDPVFVNHVDHIDHLHRVGFGSVCHAHSAGLWCPRLGMHHQQLY